MPNKKKPAEMPSVEVVEEKPSPRETADEGPAVVLARDIYPGVLPIIPIETRPFFPGVRAPLIIEDDLVRQRLVERTLSGNKMIGLILRKENQVLRENSDSEAPSPDDLFRVGVLAEILQVAQAGEGGLVQIILGALERFRAQEIYRDGPHLEARVSYELEDEFEESDEIRAYTLAVVNSIKELIKLDPLHKEELRLFMAQTPLDKPGRLADFAAALTSANGEDLQEVLECFDILSRLETVLWLLKKEIEIARLQTRISNQVEEKLSKQQREFFLREQLKAIKKELGLEKEGRESEIERFEARMEKLQLSEEAAGRVEEELAKLKVLDPSSPEYNVSRNYIDWLTVLPWGVFSQEIHDLAHSAEILDRDHYGLKDVKDRILEFLSVGIVKGNISGSILCFVGPPGVGKTSIGRSIAEAVGREFYRFSVGGMRDEAEIKGHRRTYIGALPGKFLQAMKTCGAANPVIMLDEIDKIGASYRGDPASALLEVLDPEQNTTFQDHYLDVRFDLSNVLFICTANQLDTIPRPLLDRMEIIKLSGYILQEKMEIARRFLVPKQLREHGLDAKQLTITAPALREIISGYAREPGVRSLEMHIKRIVRKAVRRIVEGHSGRIKVEKGGLTDWLGRRIFTDESLYAKPPAGVVMGLAWTSMGGDTLLVEARGIHTGKAGYKQTGQLGKVMVESAEIAYTCVRAELSDHPNAKTFFDEHLIHLHVPAGATPKDGPSAGITMATALYSLALDRPVKKRFAMTGELSLTSQVLPVGGIKEKTIAAKRAGIQNLIFPLANRSDFEDLPEEIRRGLRPHFVTSLTEVLSLTF